MMALKIFMVMRAAIALALHVYAHFYDAIRRACSLFWDLMDFCFVLSFFPFNITCVVLVVV